MRKVNTVRLWAWVSIIALPLWFASCKKGSDDVVTPSKSAVEGNWQFSGLKISPAVDFGTGQKTDDLLSVFQLIPNGSQLVNCLKKMTITFNANGTVTGKVDSQCAALVDDVNPIEDKSTWKLDGSKLTVTSGTEVNVFDVSLSGNLLKLSAPYVDDFDGDGKDETYTQTMELTKL
ncbi:hypothetical protein GCM10028807_20350 [Spirosoma daeguense]